EFYLEPQVLHNLSYSNPHIHLDMTPRIGMDEAGKGDFFGPLCTAAVYADEEGIKTLLQMKVKDSKKTNDALILQLAQKIKTHFPYAIVRLFPEKYNELYAKFRNLNHLLAWTHTTALQDVVQKTNC